MVLSESTSQPLIANYILITEVQDLMLQLNISDVERDVHLCTFDGSFFFCPTLFLL